MYINIYLNVYSRVFIYGNLCVCNICFCTVVNCIKQLDMLVLLFYRICIYTDMCMYICIHIYTHMYLYTVSKLGSEGHGGLLIRNKTSEKKCN